MSFNFINTGLDDQILKSLNAETPDEDLQKAMNKQGLVQKEIQVKGKNGQVFTRKQWVKAGEDQKSDSGKSLEELQQEYRQYVTQHPNPTDEDRKKAAEIRDAIDKKMQEKYGPAKQQMRQDTDSAAAAKRANNSKKLQPMSPDTKKKTDKFIQDLTHSSTQSGNDTNDEQIPHKITGKNMDDLVQNLKQQGFELDSADRHSPQDTVTLYKNKKEYTATFNKYHDGGVEVISIKPSSPASGDQSDPKQPNKHAQPKPTKARKIGSVGDIENGYKSINRAIGKKYNIFNAVSVLHGESGLGESKAIVSLPKFGSDEAKAKEILKEQLDREFGDQSKFSISTDPKYPKSFIITTTRDALTSKSKDSAKPDKGKFNHMTGTYDKPKSTMIEDYFSGNHSHDDGKKALMDLLGKGYTRSDLMEQAKKSGVTWKESDHEGINWMRASMAIQKHLVNSGSNSQQSSSKAEKAMEKFDEKEKLWSTFTKATDEPSRYQDEKVMSTSGSVASAMFMHEVADVNDVAGTNKRLKKLADSMGITDNGGSLVMDNQGRVMATDKNGVSKKVYVSKPDGTGFISSPQKEGTFFSTRGMSFEHSDFKKLRDASMKSH